MPSLRLPARFGLALLLLSTLEFGAAGGEWHVGATLVCTDCHTQHNSANGVPMRTDSNPAPAEAMLLRATPMELCLSCHDGSKSNAPAVLSQSTAPDWAGGMFPLTDQATTSNAHHLNSPIAEVPPGGTQPMVLTCTTCHDPHGNSNYRNLRPDPLNAGVPISVVVKQGVTANGANPLQVYVPANLTDKGKMSAWCQTCHTAPAMSPDHPTDKQIYGAVDSTTGQPDTSWSNWTSLMTYRVRVVNPTDDVVPSQDDQVFCLSCHKAHGSPNQYALIYADGSTLDSTCQECHNQ